MGFFSEIEKERLETCDERIQRVLYKAIIPKDVHFTILCGYRNEEEQNRAFDTGRSTKRWPNSRHNKLPSTAVDIAPWPIDWRTDQDLWLMRHSSRKVAEPVLSNIKRWYSLIYFIMGVGYCLGIELESGANWDFAKFDFSDPNFVDLPHLQTKEV